MTQNTYIVTTPDNVVEVRGVAASTEAVCGRAYLAVWEDHDKTKAAALFYEWSHMTVERPESEVPDWAAALHAAFALDLANPRSADDNTQALILSAVERGFAAGVEAGRKAGREAAR